MVLAGLAIVVLALIADRINIGTGEGFGYYQLIVLIIGLVLTLLGVAILLRRWLNRPPNSDFEPEP